MSSVQNNSPKKEIFDNLVKLLNLKKFNELEKKLNDLLEQYPKSYPLFNLKGAYMKIIGDYDKAELAFTEAIKINNKIPDAYNNLGLVCIEQKKLDKSIECFNNAIKINSKNPFFVNNLGNALAQKKLFDEALKVFEKTLSIDKKFFLALNNIGIIKYKLKKYDEAIKSFEKAIEIQENFDDPYINLGNTYFEIGEIDLAIKNYKIALEKNPKSSKAYNNLGNLLNNQGLYSEAIKNYQTSIDIKPNFSEAYNNLGNTLVELDKNEEAINAYKKSIELNPKYYESYANLANIYSRKNDLQNAIFYYQKSHEINNSYDTALASLIYHKMKLADWSAVEDFKKVESNLGIKDETIMPFYSLVMQDNPKNQMLRSINYSKQKIEKFNKKKNNIKVYQNQKIKIGYYSSDFFDHATMYLISGLLREHDYNKFEIYLFNYGKNKKSKLVDDTIKYVSSYKDISKMNDDEILKLSRKLQIDISIDLKGYTLNSRSKLFAYRLSPIQINYLGYPGTLGSSFIDYIVADKTLIPKEQKSNYTEKIIYMPYCYQPNDNKRKISNKITQKKDFDLPNNSFVFCCFNTTYKITPDEFDIWSRMLIKIKNSVLWLIDTNEITKKNLLNSFNKKNIESSRIIFAKNLPHEEHLERLRHADLFLDTFNYNAHTTCSDTLWSGVPIVTKIGDQFSARVASSLLNAMDLNELITNTKNDYEKLILNLATNKENLIKIRTKIANNLSKSPLFDTKKYTIDFEKALTEAYNNNLKQENISDIVIS